MPSPSQLLFKTFGFRFHSVTSVGRTRELFTESEISEEQRRVDVSVARADSAVHAVFTRLQAFYASTKGLTIRYGDTVAARCVFTGEGRTSEVYIG